MMVQTLNVNDKQKVVYCIPEWLRDLQIQQSIKRIKGRIQPVNEPRPEPIAVVCYGPSLNETWEKVRQFKYVISCSGAHKFLIQRGIIPTYHVEVDPREHKVELLGPPHKGVEYLIASTCHAKYFDHLEGFNVKLWHVFATEAEAVRMIPHGDWAVTGGSSVGLRAMTIAAFIGFRDLHVFGMDGCEGPTGKHAAAHPNQPQDHAITEYEGVTYKTTPAMLECARQTFHELDQMPRVRATFYGEGLVQALAKKYVPKQKDDTGKFANIIGFAKPELISSEFRELNAKLHVENLAYGVGGGRHAPTVIKLADATHTRSILDYGCGKGSLAKAIPFPIWEYDPAIPGKDESPRPADLVVCTDVLEHIEPDKLDAVLDDLRRCVRKVGYFVIHTGAAQKTYADGRNTHLIQQGREWWQERLSRFFEIGKVFTPGSEVHVLVGPKLKAVTEKKKVRMVQLQEIMPS